MEFINFINKFATPALISSGIVLGALKLLGGKLINQLLQKEFEKFKTQLQEKATLLKTSLSIYAEEQNIANQRIDNQKANAIHQIYSGICKVTHPLSRIIAGSHFVSDNAEDHIDFYKGRSEEAHSASMLLSDLLVDHAIYFDEPTYKQIADLHTELSLAIAHFLKVIRKNDYSGVNPDELLDLIEKERSILIKKYQQKFQIMKYKLTKIFRYLLGIEKPNHQKYSEQT